MLIGTIRPVETVTLEVEGETLAEIRAQLVAQTPPGFELTDAPARPMKGTTKLATVAKFQRRDGEREIEADDRAALQAKVPNGYRLLAVRVI